MKKMLMRTLGVGAVLFVSACQPLAYQRPTYGWGGAGLDLAVVENACKRAAAREGWRWLRTEQAEVVGPTEARIRFQARGMAFRSHLTCFYDARTNRVTLR